MGAMDVSMMFNLCEQERARVHRLNGKLIDKLSRMRAERDQYRRRLCKETGEWPELEKEEE